MRNKGSARPSYAVPSRRREDGSEFSFYEIAKGHQEHIQAEVLKKTGTTRSLPQELSVAAHSHAAQFLEEAGGAFDTDCEKGCSYCCHQPATIFPFEAIRIAQVLKSTLSGRQLKSVIEAMQSRVHGLKGSSIEENINNKTACPLLSNEQCSVYGDRPLTCRLAHSFSVKRCRQAFEKDRFKVQIPISFELQTGISGIIEAVFEQLPRKKLDGNLYELCSAVLVALSDSDADKKWASGDLRVFKGCIKDDT